MQPTIKSEEDWKPTLILLSHSLAKPVQAPH